MSRICEGIGSINCKDNAYKSSIYCKFHLWVMDHWGSVNRIQKEYGGYQQYGKWNIPMRGKNVKI